MWGRSMHRGGWYLKAWREKKNGQQELERRVTQDTGEQVVEEDKEEETWREEWWGGTVTAKMDI